MDEVKSKVTNLFIGIFTTAWARLDPKHGPEAYITQFACGGPKNYAYKVSDGKTHSVR